MQQAGRIHGAGDAHSRRDDLRRHRLRADPRRRAGRRRPDRRRRAAPGTARRRPHRRRRRAWRSRPGSSTSTRTPTSRCRPTRRDQFGQPGRHERGHRQLRLLAGTAVDRTASSRASGRPSRPASVRTSTGTGGRSPSTWRAWIGHDRRSTCCRWSDSARCACPRWAWPTAPATGGEVATMRAGLREALAAGAWGMSTGLVYPPGTYAQTGEIVEVGRELAPDARAVRLAHPQRGGRPPGGGRGGDRDRRGDRRSGRDLAPKGGRAARTSATSRRRWSGSRPLAPTASVVHADAYPYEAGSTFLSQVLPPWVQDGGVDVAPRSAAGRGRPTPGPARRSRPACRAGTISSRRPAAGRAS